LIRSSMEVQMQAIPVGRSFFVSDPVDPWNIDYEVRIVSYRSQVPATRDDPGEAGDVELDESVTKRRNGVSAVSLSLDFLIGIIAESRAISREDAERQIKEEALEWIECELVEPDSYGEEDQ